MAEILKFTVPLFRFCVCFSLCCAMIAAAGDVTPENEIRDASGVLFPGAAVHGVTPSELTFSYLDPAGNAVLTTMPFAKLSEGTRRRFNFDQAKSDEYEKLLKNNTEEKKRHDREKAEAEQNAARMESFLNQLNGGGKVTPSVSADDLRSAVTSLRRALTVKVIENSNGIGSVSIIMDQSAVDPLAGLIQLRGIDIAPGGQWSGFAYPTGLVASDTGGGRLPVFCVSAEQALQVIDKFHEYAGMSRGGAQPERKDDSATKTDSDQPDPSLPDTGVSIGGYYYSNWISPYWPSSRWRPLHPPRPRPPRPPQPPRPPRPPQPPRPPRPPVR